ncbi:Fc.00g106800.m01.CDS01 [Cosmosporella sp. VM-42]
MRSVLLLSALAGVSTAHFLLKYPESIGFSDDDESKSPCGGFTPDLTKDLVDWHVGGEAIAVRLTHPQCNWLFRVTTDEKAESGWEQIFPIVQQSGLGDFCEPQVTIPESYIGKKGVVSIVSSAVDGLLYQCVVANFIEGSADAPSECKNASSVKISFTSDSELSALVGDSSNETDASSTTGTAAGSATGSATNSGASATNSDNAAASLQAWSASGLGNVVAMLSMALVGGALMI